MPVGGKRPGAGRPKGVPNKATRDVREAAQKFTTEALLALAKIMRKGESEQARVAAARELLDRGHGKPKFEIGQTASETLGELVQRAVAKKEKL